MRPQNTPAPALLQLTCQQCGSPFTAYRSNTRNGGKYCSRPCFRLGRRAGHVDRFWQKVNKDGPVPSHRPELGNCWEWTGSRSKNSGYGQTTYPGGKGTSAHRYSWGLHFGTIPPGLHVLHRCDNRPCVRPTHLFLGTAKDNMLDMVAKGRQADQRGHRAAQGSQHGMAKLTESQVLQIRADYAKGVTLASLAAAYGVRSSTTISQIVRREHWRHI